RTTIDNKFVRLYDWKTSARMFERQPLNGPVECRSAFCRAITRMFRRGIAGVLQFVSLTSLSGKPFLLVVPLFVSCRFAPQILENKAAKEDIYLKKWLGSR